MSYKMDPNTDGRHFNLGRPEKPVDWAKVDQLLLAGCQANEIAPHFDLHRVTFCNRLEKQYGMTFTAYSCLKKDQGDSLLKAKQFEKAMKGDTTQLIWLGKCRLKQRDYDDVTFTPTNDELNTLRHQNMMLQNENAKLKNDHQPQTEPELLRSDPPL